MRLHFFLYIFCPGFLAFTFMEVGDQPLTYYKDPRKKFSIAYPNTWKSSKATKPIEWMIHAPQESTQDQFAENVNVVIEELPDSSITSEDYHETLRENLKQYVKNYKLKEDHERMLGGQKGYEIIYTGTVNKIALQWSQVITVKNKKAYLVTYLSEPKSYLKFKKEADIIINHFKIGPI